MAGDMDDSGKAAGAWACQTGLMALLLEATGEAAALIGARGEVAIANPLFCTLLGRNDWAGSGAFPEPHALTARLSAGDRSRLQVGLGLLDPSPTESTQTLSFAVRLTEGPDHQAPLVWFEARPVPAGVPLDGCQPMPVSPCWLAVLHRDHPALQHALVTYGGDGAALVDQEGRIRALTRTTAKILGADPALLIEEPFLSLSDGADQPVLQHALASSASGAMPEACIFRLAWNTGTETCTHVQLVPGDRAGESIALLRDMTGLRALEVERDSALKAAEAAGQTKSRFLAGMSHELRTPLNAIIGFSDILSQELFGPLGNERYRDYVGLIKDSGTALLQLVTDILDLARIDAGRYMLRPERIDAAALGVEELDKWRARAAAKDILIDLALPQGRPSLEADRLALSQVLTNLLSNAVKFTGEGGRVTLAIDELDDRVEFVVMDSGVGIPGDVLPQLGRPFEQVVAESSTNGGTNGIGLALVNALVGLHQGTLGIESQVGVGTNVTVSLPKRAIRQEPVDEEKSSPADIRARSAA